MICVSYWRKKLKPTVAIIGKPNVGKSTFFNRISGKRISIVQDISGVTRDRIIADAEWCGWNFNIIDTGGLEPKSEDEMHKLIKRQAELAIATADVIVFMADYKQGITSSDYEIVSLLRITAKPIILAVNKIDIYKPEMLYDFYDLGMGEPFGISAEQGLGIGELLDEIIKHFPKIEQDETSKDAIKIAIVGKPNAGKSSLINKILGEDRVIVSEVAGTTRDSIDTPVKIGGIDYILIDTAGLRRKRSVDTGSVEAISAIMSIKAIERADVVLIMIDVSDNEISEQDIRIAGYVHDEGKPSIVVLNKWDLIEKDTYTIEKYRKELNEKLKFMSYYISIFLSAKTGKRTDKLIELVKEVYENNHRRITTGILNDIIGNAITSVEPPARAGRKLKIYYATQTQVAPPTFVLFINDLKLMHFSYQRYLENSLRSALNFTGTPINIQMKVKTK